jgi:hypothetical protein
MSVLIYVCFNRKNNARRKDYIIFKLHLNKIRVSLLGLSTDIVSLNTISFCQPSIIETFRLPQLW